MGVSSKRFERRAHETRRDTVPARTASARTVAPTAPLAAWRTLRRCCSAASLALIFCSAASFFSRSFCSPRALTSSAFSRRCSAASFSSRFRCSAASLTRASAASCHAPDSETPPLRSALPRPGQRNRTPLCR